MKKTAILVALMMVATASFGAINIGWSNYGFLSGASDKAATQDATQILWELVYTASSSIATPVLDSKTGSISYGSDEVLSSRLWKEGSTEITVTDKVTSSSVSPSPLVMDLDYGYSPTDGQSYINLDYTKSEGGIYAAVFQYCSNGDVYWAWTDLNTNINWANEKSAADGVDFDMTADTKIATKLGTYTPEPGPGPQPQVPEPATMSLLGLGALAMVLRRKLRK